jgi:hypothetical protein
VGLVGTRIYANELSSSEVFGDKSQVERFSPLLDAVARGDRTAVREAVTSLVFSHTHVVRLRVSRGGEVLADVGGPDILAPVNGSLRRGGRTVGHYTLSVQDDLGYVKLVTRFTGAPLVLRAGSRTLPVAGTLAPAPTSIPEHGAVKYRGSTYQAFSFNAQVFPSGPLRISLLVPVPGSLSGRTCSEIKVDELGAISNELLLLHQSDRAADGRVDLHSLGLAPTRGQHAPGTAHASRTGRGQLSPHHLRGVLVHDRNPSRSGAHLPARGAVA